MNNIINVCVIMIEIFLRISYFYSYFFNCEKVNEIKVIRFFIKIFYNL